MDYISWSWLLVFFYLLVSKSFLMYHIHFFFFTPLSEKAYSILLFCCQCWKDSIIVIQMLESGLCIILLNCSQYIFLMYIYCYLGKELFFIICYVFIQYRLLFHWIWPLSCNSDHLSHQRIQWPCTNFGHIHIFF